MVQNPRVAAPDAAEAANHQLQRRDAVLAGRQVDFALDIWPGLFSAAAVPNKKQTSRVNSTGAGTQCERRCVVVVELDGLQERVEGDASPSSA